ncbi:MurR/RpiR family transcriptional regulator [Dolosicoccus paucivorans]
MNRSLESLYNDYFAELTDNEKDIFDYILRNDHLVSDMSIQELADNVFTSKSSVLRFTQKIGFSGYSEFKYFLNQLHDQVKPTKIPQEDHFLDDVLATKKLFDQTHLEPLLNSLQRAPRIFVYGTGWGQRNVLNDLKRNFILCDRFVIEVTARRELGMTAKIIQPEDVLIVVSLSGDVSNVSKQLQLFQARGVTVIGITQLQKSLLASIADHTLYFQTTSYPVGEEIMVSFLPIYYVVDLLVRHFLVRIGKIEAEE